MTNASNELLTPTAFAVLFALSIKPQHGYSLAQQIEEDSLGKLHPGSGALYGCLKHLHTMYFIEEVPSETMHDRRRSYRLTKKGWDRLAEEFLYYQHIAQQGRKRQI